MQFGTSGTIYDPPPVQPFIYAVGSPDLNVPLGGGFQAAHAWINNQSNQSLYIPGAPDVVPPGVTRVVALAVGDVAQASWTIPPVFGVVQAPGPTGAAIIIFLNAGVDIAPHPGVANNPLVSVASGNVTVSGQVTIGAGANVIGAISAINSSVTVAGTVNIGNTPAVSISGTPTVNIGNTPSVVISGTASVNIANTPSVVISGTPTVILGGGTASIGSISAISSTVTVAGTINIGNTPSVVISGTASVSIASGTVNIGGQPTINVQAANGVNIQGPNLLPVPMRGPITGGWGAALNSTVVFNGDGTMTITQTANGDANRAQNLTTSGPFALIPVSPGETYQLSASFKTLDHANRVALAVNGYDAGLGGGAFSVIASGLTVLNTWLSLSGNWVVPANVYYLQFAVYSAGFGTGTAGDRCVVDHAAVQNVGAFPMNAQQGGLPVNQPQEDLGQISSPANGEGVTTLTLPVGTQAVAIRIDSSLYAKYDHITVRGRINQPNTKTTYFTTHFFNQEVFAFPVLSTFDQQIEVAIQNSDNATVVTVEVVALLQSVPEFLQLFPQPQLAPNQLPLMVDNANIPAATAVWVILPVAGLQIDLFEIIPSYVTGTGLQYIFGHGTTLPLVSPSSKRLLVSGNSGSFLYEYHGAQLPRGEGIWVWNNSVNPITLLSTLLNYSLS